MLNEGLDYKCFKGKIKPTLHIDEFSSKMGEDDEICVLSFYISDRNAAKDLVNWFEKGYDFVMDSDMSPGEIKPNRYLVYVEIKRRTNLPYHIADMLDDLNTLTEWNKDDWQCHHRDQIFDFDEKTFGHYVALSPKDYREQKEKGLNEMRQAAGMAVKDLFVRTAEMKDLQAKAGF